MKQSIVKVILLISYTPILLLGQLDVTWHSSTQRVSGQAGNVLPQHLLENSKGDIYSIGLTRSSITINDDVVLERDLGIHLGYISKYDRDGQHIWTKGERIDYGTVNALVDKDDEIHSICHGRPGTNTIDYFRHDADWNLLDQIPLVILQEGSSSAHKLDMTIVHDTMYFSFFSTGVGWATILDEPSFEIPEGEAIYLCKANIKTKSLIWKKRLESPGWRTFQLGLLEDDLIGGGTYERQVTSTDIDLASEFFNTPQIICMSIDPHGQTNWARSFGGVGFGDYCGDLKVTDQIYITGNWSFGEHHYDGFENVVQLNDVFVMTINENGTITNATTLDINDDPSYLQRIDVHPDGHVFLAGRYKGNVVMANDSTFYSGQYHQSDQFYLFQLDPSLQVINGQVFRSNDRSSINALGDLLISGDDVIVSTSVSCNIEGGNLSYTESCEAVNTGGGLLFKGSLPSPVRESSCVDLDLFALLEGPLTDRGAYRSSMRTDLNNFGYLPGQIPKTLLGTTTGSGQPFNSDPWFYDGTEGKDYIASGPDDPAYPSNIVDWILIRIFDSTMDRLLTSVAGLLRAEGQIFVDDATCIDVSQEENVYVQLEHRNHLTVMTPSPVVVSNGRLTHDFTSHESFTSLFGYGQKEISTGRYAMYAGNGDQTLGVASRLDINLSDSSFWESQNGMHSGYYLADFDLSGDVNVVDKAIWLRNIGIFSDVPRRSFFNDQ